MRVDQREYLASLERDLSTVAKVIVTIDDDRDDHCRARLLYWREQLSLYGDPAPAPELEMGRAVRLQAFRKRLTILRDELDGKRLVCRLPCGVEVFIEVLGARP